MEAAGPCKVLVYFRQTSPSHIRKENFFIITVESISGKYYKINWLDADQNDIIPDGFNVGT